MPYEIKFAADVRQHLEALTARERSTALEVIEDSFCTNHWSRRGIGNLRAFYEVVPGDPDVVRIVAVGKKKGNVVRIAGKEIEL